MNSVERFRPLFHPRGVAISGVSAHPGKWGFLFLHHILRFGYPGTALGNAQFGIISGQYNDPRLVQFALRFLF